MYFTKVHGRYIVEYLSRKIVLRNRQVLDFGSGPGFLFEKMIEHQSGAIYSALDFSEDSITVLREKFRDSSLFRAAHHVNRLPSDIHEKFDVIIACELIEHLDSEHLAQVLGEIKRLLSPSGVVFFTTPNHEDLSALKRLCPECGCIYHQWQHVKTWTGNSLSNHMEANGFETILVDEVHFANIKSRLNYYLKKLTGEHAVKPHLVYLGKLRS